MNLGLLYTLTSPLPAFSPLDTPTFVLDRTCRFHSTLNVAYGLFALRQQLLLFHYLSLSLSEQTPAYVFRLCSPCCILLTVRCARLSILNVVERFRRKHKEAFRVWSVGVDDHRTSSDNLISSLMTHRGICPWYVRSNRHSSKELLLPIVHPWATLKSRDS